ncbi:MAG TPA: hypothetical protein VFO80_13470 [Sphingomonas sp.]|nr:hypothetical protein [Sphingomonas sp.]
MLTLLLALLAPQQDIVVTAEREKAAKAIGRQVDAILPPLWMDQPVARFTDPVCPGVVGLSTKSGQAVVDRIGVIVDDLGLKVGEPGCNPNLLVIVTPNSRTMVETILKRRAGVLASQSLADYRRIRDEPGSARGWVESEIRSRDGDRSQPGNPGEPPTLSVQGSSRIVQGFRRDIVSAVVIIDSAAAATRDTDQIADYAAMRALVDARPGRKGQGRTILAVFAPGAGTDVPRTLTETDRGILRGAYSGQGNVPWGMKRGTIVQAIIDGGPK